MSAITRWAMDDKLWPSAPSGQVYLFKRKIPVITGLVAQNDTINLATLPKGHYVLGGRVEQSATLGASCTLTGRVGTVEITLPTTAAAASVVGVTVAHPLDFAARQQLDLLVEGAAIAATADIYVAYLIANMIGAN